MVDEGVSVSLNEAARLNASLAAPGSIDGTATEASGQARLKGVKVAVKSAHGTRTVTTDSRGHYRVNGPAAGTYSVTFTAPRHQARVTRGVAVRTGRTNTVNQKLARTH